jgi:hypothetical protein
MDSVLTAQVAHTQNGATGSTSAPVSRSLGARLLLGVGVLFMPYLFAWVTLLKGFSGTYRFWSFVWMILLLLGLAFGNSKSPKSSSTTTSTATSTSRPQSAAQVCSNVKFSTTCFVNPDGQTCSEEGGPVAALIRNGSYSVVGQSVNEKGTCVLTLQVQGSVLGNSYNKTVQVWGYK